MRRGNSPEVNTVEGDQGQEGYVLVRTTSDRDRRSEVVELVQELYDIHEGRAHLTLIACLELREGNKRPNNTMFAPGDAGSG